MNNNYKARSQIMWWLAVPLAALILALLAIPLGAGNPRLGRSGDLLIAGLVGLLYMNLINLSRGWIGNGQLSFGVGVWLIHAVFTALMMYIVWRKLGVKAPREARWEEHTSALPSQMRLSYAVLCVKKKKKKKSSKKIKTQKR